MNKKLLALSGSILIALTLVMVPGFGLLPPIPPPETKITPEIAVKIEGDWSHTLPPLDHSFNWTYCMDIPLEDTCDGVFSPFTLKAPAFCTDIDVEIWLLNVTKLYSYDFRLLWNYGFMDLKSYSLVAIGEGMGEQHVVDADDITPGIQPMFVQVWTHLGAVDGFTGSAKVADLVFHINQDPVWPDIFYGLIYIFQVEASGPSTNPIVLSPKHGLVKLESVEPKMSFEPEDLVIVWQQGKQITFKVDVKDVVKMKSFELYFSWNNTVYFNNTAYNFPMQLILDAQKHPIVITDFLPGPYEDYYVTYGDNYVFIEVQRDCEKPGINGTGVIAEITLTAISPWGYKDVVIPEMCYTKHRKVVPTYTWIESMGGETVHLWCPDECHDNITAELAIDGIQCFQNNEEDHYDPNEANASAPYLGWYNFGIITLGSTWGTTTYVHVFDPMYILYDFRPISGDLDMSGHVGLEDLMEIAEFYGANALDPYWAQISDLNLYTNVPSANEIDIFDLTVVAKQFCKNKPFYWPHEEPYLDP